MYKEQKEEIDLILMDMQMPVMGGLEASEIIRSIENKDEHIPIIALTANAMKSDMQECFKAGMDDFVAKPMDIKKLVRMIDKYNSNETNSIS